METNVTNYEVNVKAEQAHKELDSLIAKAEYLKNILIEIDATQNIDEEIELAERIVPGELLQVQIPQLVYSVDMGTLMQLAGANHKLFTPEFLERVSKDLMYFISPEGVVANGMQQAANALQVRKEKPNQTTSMKKGN